jgi:hypothetical protein
MRQRGNYFSKVARLQTAPTIPIAAPCSRTRIIMVHGSHTQAARLQTAPTMLRLLATLGQRRGTISIFNGPPPSIAVFASQDDEAAAAGRWIAARLAEGVQPDEIGVFVRAQPQLARALAAIEAADASASLLNEQVAQAEGSIAISTMRLAD